MLLPTIIGHRGARGEAPENTLASFEHALSQGCVHFELDIRLSKDHELVVLHDSTTERTTGQSGIIEALTLQELEQYDARTNTAPWPECTPITSLHAIVSACHPHVQSWQFEVKSTRPSILRIIAEKLAALIEHFDLQERAVVTSLDKRMVAIMQQTQPQVQRGFVCEFARKAPVETALTYGCSHLCLNWKLATAGCVADAKSQGLHVSVWTVNDLKIADSLMQVGVDSIITDYPTALLAHHNMLQHIHTTLP